VCQVEEPGERGDAPLPEISASHVVPLCSTALSAELLQLRGKQIAALVF
jgi:hypothetical protein